MAAYRRWLLSLAVILVTLALAALAGLAIPAIVAPAFEAFGRAGGDIPDPEAEYWRGVYDVCLAQTRQPELCLEATAKFYEHRDDWYGTPSPGWQWPLPAPSRPYPAQQRVS